MQRPSPPFAQLSYAAAGQVDPAPTEHSGSGHRSVRLPGSPWLRPHLLPWERLVRIESQSHPPISRHCEESHSFPE